MGNRQPTNVVRAGLERFKDSTNVDRKLPSEDANARSQQ